MRALLSLLFMLLITHGAYATEVMRIQEDWEDADAALAQQDWHQASLLLDSLQRQDLTPRQSYHVTLNRAWVYLQLGQKELAGQILDAINPEQLFSDYRPNVLEIAAYEDTHLAILLDGISGLPNPEERVI